MSSKRFSQDFSEITKATGLNDLFRMMTENPDTGAEYFATLRELMDAYNGSVIAKKSEVTSEAAARNQADTTLQQNILTEATTRNQADTSLFEHINNEATARVQGDTTERNARVAADALKLNRDEITITCTLREKDNQGDSQKLIFNDYVFPLSIENGEILKFYHTNTPYNLTVESIDEANSFFANVVLVDSDFQFSGFGQEILIALTIPQDFILKSINAYLQAFEEKFYTRETGIAEYGRRVYSNGGKMNNNQLSDLLYRKNMNLMNEAVFYWDGVLGTTIVNGKASKIYNFKGTNDAVQATDANRPFVAGTIAPNESLKLKGLNSTDKKSLSISTSIVLRTTQDWSISFVIKLFSQNQNGVVNVLGSSSSNSTIRILNELLNLVNTSAQNYGYVRILSKNEYGKNITISIISNKNSISIIKNGKTVGTISDFVGELYVNTLMNALDNGSTSSLNGEMNHISIFNKALSASEIQTHHAALKLLHPDIEGVDIGNQHWATSNYDGVVTGDGTVIPEVQDAAAWDALTTPAWCYYNNDPSTGAIYGKLYNGYAIKAIAKNPPKGWRVPQSYDYEQLFSFLGGSNVAGLKLKANYSNYNDANSSNSSGFSAIPGGGRFYNTNFIYFGNYTFLWAVNNSMYFMISGGTSVQGAGEGGDQRNGASLRLIRNEPTGDDIKCVSTGVFTTDIDGAEKQVVIPFGHVVKSIRIKSANNLSNVNCILCDPSGVQMAVLLDDKSIYAGVPRVFNVLYEAPELMQDGTIRMSGTGNGGDGMQVDYIIEKSVKSELW